MDDNTNGRSCDPARVSSTSSDLRDTLVLSSKILALLIIVSTLSFGLIGCSIFFIWMCFKYPQSAETFLPSVIPVIISSVALLYGKKMVTLLKNGKDQK